MQSNPIGYYVLGGFDIIFGLWLGLWGFRYEYDELARWFHFAFGALFVVPGFVIVWWTSENRPIKKAILLRAAGYLLATLFPLYTVIFVDNADLGSEETGFVAFLFIVFCFFAGNAILSWRFSRRLAEREDLRPNTVGGTDV